MVESITIVLSGERNCCCCTGSLCCTLRAIFTMNDKAAVSGRKWVWMGLIEWTENQNERKKNNNTKYQKGCAYWSVILERLSIIWHKQLWERRVLENDKCGWTGVLVGCSTSKQLISKFVRKFSDKWGWCKGQFIYGAVLCSVLLTVLERQQFKQQWDCRVGGISETWRFDIKLA